MATWTALLADWTNKAVSVLRLNAYLGSGGNLDWLKLRAQRPIAETGGTLTIATGAVTVAPVNGYGHYKIATQSAAAADDLDTISGGSDGDIIILEMATAGQVPTLKNGTGNILLSADVALSVVTTVVMLRRDGTNWKAVALPPSASQGPSVGDIKMRFDATAEAGWLRMDEGTIGDASSSASLRANADCEALFLHWWNKLADAQAPVVGGRGANAAADWAAHKKLTLPLVPGRSPVGAGAGAGLTSRTVGATGGEEAHALTSAENAAHTHPLSVSGGGAGTYDLVYPNLQSPTPADTPTGSSGSGTAHNTMQPFFAIYFYAKL